jgi:hypothetical protein
VRVPGAGLATSECLRFGCLLLGHPTK